MPFSSWKRNRKRQRGRINNVNAGRREDSKRSGRWRLSMQILAATRDPEPCVLPPFIFLSISAIFPTDAAQGRKTNSWQSLPSQLVGIFYVWQRKNWSSSGFSIHTLLNSIRNIVTVADSIVKEASRWWFTICASPFCFPDKNLWEKCAWIFTWTGRQAAARIICVISVIHKWADGTLQRRQWSCEIMCAFNN